MEVPTDEIPIFSISWPQPEPGSYEAYIGHGWARCFVNQFTVPTLRQSARNLIEDTPEANSITDKVRPSLDASDMLGEIPPILHRFLLPSRPEEDFEPDPQLNMEFIHQYILYLWQKFPRDSKGGAIIRAAHYEFEVLKLNCKSLFYKILMLQRSFAAFADHMVLCRHLQGKARREEDTWTVALANHDAILKKGPKMYKEFENLGNLIDHSKSRVVSQKKTFVLTTLILLFNVQMSSIERGLGPLTLPPGFDINDWLKQIDRVRQMVTKEVQSKKEARISVQAAANEEV